MTDPQATEVEFTFHDSDYFLFRLCEQVGCECELVRVLPWTDGRVVKYFRSRGAAPDRVEALLRQAPEVSESRILERTQTDALFELVIPGELSTFLAENHAVLINISAANGKGTLRALIPPNLDANDVIESFLRTFDGAELTKRHTTSYSAPLGTRDQFASEVLDGLTDKQIRVLRVALSSGYFESPRRKTGEEIADHLGISSATFSQHLRAGLEKLLTELFE